MKGPKQKCYWVELEQVSRSRRMIQVVAVNEKEARAKAERLFPAHDVKEFSPHSVLSIAWTAIGIGDSPSTARQLESPLALAKKDKP